VPTGRVNNPGMEVGGHRRTIAWSVCAVLIGCSAGSNVDNGRSVDIANAKCPIGTWTLTRVVDRPARTPPWQKRGTATITFEADGTGTVQEDGVDASYQQDGHLVSQTADVSDMFTWVNHDTELSYPTDSPTLTISGQSQTNAVVLVLKRRPESFRCNGNALTLIHTVNDSQSVTHQTLTAYRRD
jgi:hypothetical protein